LLLLSLRGQRTIAVKHRRSNKFQDDFSTKLHLAGGDGAVFHAACGGESLLIGRFYEDRHYLPGE
jgi:hypothetical protein